jgi:hypothetical protein
MKANLLRLQNEWETFQSTNARDAVYQYRGFRTRLWWAQEGRAVDRAHRAFHLRGHHSVREPEAFATIIRCTSDAAKVDDRTRSKSSRVLRYAAEYKDRDEPLRDFIKCRGSINECASRFARRLCSEDHTRALLKPIGFLC